MTIANGALIIPLDLLSVPAFIGALFGLNTVFAIVASVIRLVIYLFTHNPHHVKRIRENFNYIKLLLLFDCGSFKRYDDADEPDCDKNTERVVNTLCSSSFWIFIILVVADFMN